MHFWSEGLGDRELVMGLDRAKLARKGDFIALTGIVDSPAPWEYEVKIQFEDWIAILRTATSNLACDFIATHVNIVPLMGMVWSIVKLVVLLAAFRLARLMGFRSERAADAIPSARTKWPTGAQMTMKTSDPVAPG